MLCLSRNEDQSVIISFGGVRVRVVPIKIENNRVTLGFEAPRSVAIHREEVQALIDEDAIQTAWGEVAPQKG